MTTSSRQRARRTGAPAAALLGKPAARPVAPSAAQPEPVFDLPPLPDTPPPLPEGVTEGFAPPPEGATRAREEVDLDDVDLTPAEVPIDPVTGQEAVVLDTKHGGTSEELKAELEQADKLRAAEARAEAAEAELAALRENAPMDLEGANEIGGLGPANQANHEEHRRAQARYRALRQQQLVNGNPPPEPPPPELEVESAEERRERVATEAKAEYERRVAEMPADEPRYVVGTRPPRPKVAGHTLSIGDVVPGAAYFARLETWLSTGVLRKVE